MDKRSRPWTSLGFLLWITSLTVLHTEFDALKSNYDDTAWLRKIADTQKHSIAEYVRAECWVLDAWFSQDSPFIDLRFVVRSCCVYKVSVVGIGGSISFGYRRLTQPLAITHNLVQSLSIGQNGYLTITQPLSKEDAAFILNNREQQFYVTDFSIQLESSPPLDEGLNLKLDPLVGKTATWEKYPKLKMQIKAVGSFISNTQQGAMEPAFLTLEVEIENLREGDVQIDTIRLATFVSDRNVVTSAETGDIYQEMSIANGQRYNSHQLKNLATFPLVIAGRSKVWGCLQFFLEGVDLMDTLGAQLSSTLTLTDKFGEQHQEDCVTFKDDK